MPNKKDPALLGFQIVETESDNPPEEMTTYEVYPLSHVIAWLREQNEPSRWRLIPIFNGDVDEPVFPYGVEDIDAYRREEKEVFLKRAPS